MLRLAYFLKNLQMSRENKLRVLGNKKAKPSGYRFCMDTKI